MLIDLKIDQIRNLITSFLDKNALNAQWQQHCIDEANRLADEVGVKCYNQ